jgi:hypothetical protein
MMAERIPEQAGSILAVDIGSVVTRAVLIDQVGGHHQLIARAATPSSFGYPHLDAQVAVDRLLDELAAATGRRFRDTANRFVMPELVDRSGVDAFVLSTSAVPPQRALLVGLVDALSVAALRRALAGAPVEIVGAYALDDGLSFADRVRTTMDLAPDLIVVAGGTDEGAAQPLLDLLKPVRLAVAAIDYARRPALLFAGNRALQPTVMRAFGTLTQVIATDNLMPATDQVQSAVISGALIRLAKAHNRSLAGIEKLLAMGATQILPTSYGYRVVAEYLAGRDPQQGHRVMLVDIGAVSSTIAWADGHGTDLVWRQQGLGHSAEALLDAVGPRAIGEWLPYGATPLDLRHYALNRSFHPGSVPHTLRELFMEYAMLRALARHLLARMERQGDPGAVDVLVAAGGALTGTGNEALTMLLLVDIAQPSGITDVYSDPYGLVAMAAGTAQACPAALVDLFEGQGLQDLGAVITFGGALPAGREVAQVRLEVAGEDAVEYRLHGGDLHVFPLADDQPATVTITCSGGARVAGERKLEHRVRTGSLLLMLDARGRPLNVGATLAERGPRLVQWMQQATNRAEAIVPDAWFDGPDLAQTPEAAASPDAAASEDAVPTRAKRSRRQRRKDKAAKGRQADVPSDVADADFWEVFDEMEAKRTPPSDEELDALFDEAINREGR